MLFFPCKISKMHLHKEKFKGTYLHTYFYKYFLILNRYLHRLTSPDYICNKLTKISAIWQLHCTGTYQVPVPTWPYREVTG